MRHCAICGRPAERHHILSRGAWGKAAETPDNIIHLCPSHHTLGPTAIHRMGVRSWARHYGLEDRVSRARDSVCGSFGD